MSLILRALLVFCALFAVIDAFGKLRFQDQAQVIRFNDPVNENDYWRMVGEAITNPQRRAYRLKF